MCAFFVPQIMIMVFCMSTKNIYFQSYKSIKKFLSAILLFFILQQNVSAQTCVSFIYINGSNIKDKKISRWYLNAVKKFHPCLKNALEKDPFVQKHLLRCGQYFIEEKPVIFYWGDKNHNGKTSENPGLANGITTYVAYKIRRMFGNIMHDVIWSEKHCNMKGVLDDLQKNVKCEVQKGNKVILLGYSSGNFITYEYLMTRTPYIKVADLFNAANISNQQREFVSQHPMQDTCMAALEQGLGVFSIDGHIILNPDVNSFQKSYMNLDNETDAVCMPKNSVLGVVNLANPLVLFYSEPSASDFPITYYNRLLYKYIIENNMFWLSVNYREDPFSFPCGKNLTVTEIETATGLNINPCCGFIYDQSSAKGGIRAIMHLSYLTQRRILCKAIIKAYVEGYKYQHFGAPRVQNNDCGKKLYLTP